VDTICVKDGSKMKMDKKMMVLLSSCLALLPRAHVQHVAVEMLHTMGGLRTKPDFGGTSQLCLVILRVCLLVRENENLINSCGIEKEHAAKVNET
jgi:hypothetical protein